MSLFHQACEPRSNKRLWRYLVEVPCIADRSSSRQIQGTLLCNDTADHFHATDYVWQKEEYFIDLTNNSINLMWTCQSG